MRNIIFGLLIAIPVCGIGLASANDDIAIDLSVSGEIAPGVYGRVNIGNEHPVVVNEQPVIIRSAKHHEEPIYLVVPPGHSKHWEKHCAEYNACDRRVYFINPDKYNEEYRHRKHDHGHDRGHDHDDHHDYDEHHHHDESDHDEGHDHGHDRD